MPTRSTLRLSGIGVRDRIGCGKPRSASGEGELVQLTARSFAVPKGAVLAVAFSPDSRALLSAHFDTTVRLWDRDTGRELRRFSGHKQMVACVAVSPDGARLASGSHDANNTSGH